MMQDYKSVDEYIKAYPKEVQVILKKVRETIKEAAPEAEECISYGMPAYKYNGPVVYFGGQKNHLGFYPTGDGVENFKKELSGYTFSKGSIQFPYNKPIPYDLIKKITNYRINKNKKI